MDARRVVGAVSLLLLVVLAGCSAAGHLELQDASDDATLAEGASRSLTPHGNETTSEQAVVRRAIENGSATTRGQQPAVDPGLPFAHEDRYYNVSWTVIDRERATSARIGIDYNGTASAAATVGYENLSERDRAVIDQLLPPRGDHRNPGPDFGVAATYDDAERNRSVLLGGEYAAVRYEGETYPVQIEGTEPVTVRTYRYDPTVVANTSAEYAERLRSRYLFTLSGLSDAERSVLQEAIDDRYYAEDDSDDAFRSVMERIRAHEAVQRDEYQGTWLVRYQGTVYLADLGYEGFELQ